MIRTIRAQVVLMSMVSLLAVSATTVLSVPVAAAAHSSKKSKKHKKGKKHPAKKVAKVSAGTETLTFDTQAVQALEKAKVSSMAVSPTTGALSSGFVFPLTGGTLNPNSGLGSLTAAGGIAFETSFSVPGLFSSGSSSTISQPGLALNSAPTMSFTSQQVSPPTFPFAAVSLKGVHPVAHGEAITLTNMPVSLTATGAQFLNQFASGAFSAGETVGSVTVQVTASK